MTKQERKLWYDFLRYYPIKFYRQRPIGNYIVDFYCSKAKLAIELDGSQHYEPVKKMKDDIRTRKISKYGVHVLRFYNYEVVKNFEGVCATIDFYVRETVDPSVTLTSSRASSPFRGAMNI